MTLANRLAECGTATVSEAWPACRLAEPSPRPLGPDMRIAGPALPVRCRPGDNLALHLAIAEAGAGSVIVLDYGGDCGSGPFGEIMALACQVRGVAGLVTNGAVRDSRQIVELGFPVFACGLNVRGTAKLDRGIIGEPVVIGGARVELGDIVVADADGIVIVPKTDAEAALAASIARASREAAMMDRLRRGETTLEILGLEGRRP